jgi:hypothetical protein
MNLKVPIKQETKPGQFAEHSPVLTGLSQVYRGSNAIPKASITCGELHPSPPN